MGSCLRSRIYNRLQCSHDRRRTLSVLDDDWLKQLKQESALVHWSNQALVLPRPAVDKVNMRTCASRRLGRGTKVASRLLAQTQ